MTFFSTLAADIKHSFYGPEAYTLVAQGGRGQGVRFAFISGSVIAIMALLGTVVGFGYILKSDFITTVTDLYPNELVLTIKDGVASTNVNEPYVIPFPSGWKQDAKEPKNLVVIDTTHSLSIDEVKAYDAGMVIGDKSFYSKDKESIRITDISSVAKNYTLTKTIVDSYARTLHPVFYILLVIAPFIVFFFVTLFAGLYYLLVGLFGALLVLLITKLRGWSLSYKQAYAVALFAQMPVAIVGVLLGVLSFPSSFWLNLALFAVIVLVNFNTKEPTQTPVAVA